MTRPFPQRPALQRRIELLGTCAMVALTIGLVQSRDAQAAPPALQGTPTIVLGGTSQVTIDNNGPSGGASAVDTINVNTSAAIINWNTLDQTTNTTIDFLPQNAVANFTGQTNYVVLNRIFAATATQPIALNGIVNATDFGGQRNGSVWFYSPGGIIAGQNSVFNVGNLVLTADDIDTTGGLFGANNTIRFRGAAGSTSAITIQPGAQINQTAAGSYLALVAPQVNMGGTVTINGSAAYIAAEHVDVRINGGLFDIAFLAGGGTGVAAALTHTGTTTGPAAANGTIAMAALPKNTAITMLVGGTIGYTPAASASVQNGTVVLSAGQDVVLGRPNDPVSGGTFADLTLNGGTFSSSVVARGNNRLVANPSTSASLTFTGNLDLSAPYIAELHADAGETVRVNGNLTITSRGSDRTRVAYVTAEGVGSLLTVAGLTRLDADGFGADSFSAAPGANGFGGNAQIASIGGGSLQIGNAILSANGTGGFGAAQSGDGTGGVARLRVDQPFGLSTPTINVGDLSLTAQGIGGQGGGQFPTTAIGGTGTGGLAFLQLFRNTATIGDFTLDAQSRGGNAGVSGQGGNTLGGVAYIDANGGTVFAGVTTLNANETAGFAGNGGTTGSTSGSARAIVDAPNGAFVSLSSLEMGADARTGAGASVSSPGPATTGTIRAGGASLGTLNGGTISISGAATLHADAIGTTAFAPVTSGPTTGGGVSVGGSGNGTINIGSLTASANAFATAASVSAGAALAGNVNISMFGGSSITSNAGISLKADATSADGPVAANVTGGSIFASLDGSFTANDAFALSASGTAGRSSALVNGSAVPSGSGAGGTINLSIGGNTDVDVAALSVVARGIGGNGTMGDVETSQPSTPGGDGIGGNATLTQSGGNLFAGAITVDASGIGGNNPGGLGTIGANAGAGTGGTATFMSTLGAFLETPAVTVLSNGTGGNADPATLGAISSLDTFTGGDGGKGTGGTSTVELTADQGSVPSLLVNASAFGGSGANADANNPVATGRTGGRGGDATAGTASVRLGGTTANYSSITIRSEAQGANAGFGEVTQRGGDAVGGRSELIVDNVALNSGDITLTSTANAGSARFGVFGAGPRGGDATGGSTYFEIGGTDGSFDGSGFITMDARANAANGIDGTTGTTGKDGGRGGNALGGSATLVASGGLFDLSNLEGFDLSVDAVGGNAGTGGNATTYQPTGGGRGGDAGTGAGGTVLINAKGGTLIADTLDISANGTAGQFAAGGFDTGKPATITTPAIPATFGGYGAFNYGQGGTVSAVANTNQKTGLDGTLDIGTLSASASGDTASFTDYGFGGTVFVTNLNFDETALRLGSLSIDVGDPDTFYSGNVSIGATNGPIQIANNVDIFSSGDVNLESANGHAIQIGGSLSIEAGGSVFGFQNDFTDPGSAPGLTARSLDISGEFGVLLATLKSDIRDAIRLDSSVGPIQTGDLTAGDDIDVFGASTISSGKLTTTGLGIDAGQDGSNIIVNGGALTSNLILGDLNSAGYVEVRGGTVSAGNVTAANDAILSAFAGPLTVGNVTAGDDVWLSVFGSSANPDLVAPEPITSKDSTTQNLLTAGTITSTGLGNDSATSGAFTFGNAGPTGNIIRVRSSGSVNLSDVTTPDTLIIISDHDAVTTASLNATSGIDVAAQNSVTLGNVTSNGALRIENSNQVPLIFSSYRQGQTFIGNSTSTGPGFGQPGIYGLVKLNDVDAQGLRVFAEAVDYGNIRLTRGLGIDVRYADDSFDPGNTLDGHIHGGSITAGIDVDNIIGMDAIGDVTFTNISTGGYVEINAGVNGEPGSAITGDAITAGYFTLSTGGNLDVGTVIGNAAPTFSWQNALGAGGTLRVGELQSSFPFFAGGSDVYIRSTASLSDGTIVARTNNIDVAAGGDLRLNSVQAPGTVSLRSTNGDISLFDLGTGLSPLIPTDATIQADSGSISIQNARVSNGITVDARSFISLNNFISGRTVTLRSSEIGIGGETRVGQLETTDSVEFVNTGGGTTYVGGTGTESPGYHLDNAELQHVAADAIGAGVDPPNLGGAGQSPLSLTPGVAPDLVLDTVTLQGGVNLGNGTLLIRTPGKMQVIGAVTLTGLADTNGVDLRAGSSIEVTPAGSISLRGANGVAGTLNLTSEDIIASTATALTSVAAATDLKARSDILGGNDATASGQPLVRTVFEAGGIVATVSQGLYIQNSGATATAGNSDFAGRRGFVTGSGGFTIVQQQANSISIAINGQQIRPSTTTGAPVEFINGGDVIPEIKFIRFDDTTVYPASTLPNPAGVFDPLSTVNGCAITFGATCQSITPPPEPEPQFIPDVDQARDPIRNDFGISQLAIEQPFVLITLKDFLPPVDEPLIDEPVTGAGNDDLWSVDDANKCDPATTTCG